ncbi:NUDIX domain-containing protein [Nocardia sp. NPDC059239]|uniref:NUDIX domain-containing protein n=1 Tax=unclassified Nocardia TaxID=2637762 RepID=UPI0036A87EF4
MQPATAMVADVVAAITPVDELERQHRATTLEWLASTDDIFRRVKPATPSPHLVAYVVLVDPRERGIFLGRHRMAGLHLPMGGHVEAGEHPRDTARREAGEELGIEPVFDLVGEHPLFLTRTTTVGQAAGHIDVSLWYVIRGERTRDYPLDPTEFDGGQWWDLDPDGLPATDPHLPRFILKLDDCQRGAAITTA